MKQPLNPRIILTQEFQQLNALAGINLIISKVFESSIVYFPFKGSQHTLLDNKIDHHIKPLISF